MERIAFCTLNVPANARPSVVAYAHKVFATFCALNVPANASARPSSTLISPTRVVVMLREPEDRARFRENVHYLHGSRPPSSWAHAPDCSPSRWLTAHLFDVESRRIRVHADERFVSFCPGSCRLADPQ